MIQIKNARSGQAARQCPATHHVEIASRRVGRAALRPGRRPGRPDSIELMDAENGRLPRHSRAHKDRLNSNSCHEAAIGLLGFKTGGPKKGGPTSGGPFFSRAPSEPEAHKHAFQKRGLPPEISRVSASRFLKAPGDISQANIDLTDAAENRCPRSLRCPRAASSLEISLSDL